MGDITLKADISFGGAAPLRVKLRKAEAGADSFNNTPRYDQAAYELQKLFLDPQEYVIPPTVLRMAATRALRQVFTGRAAHLPRRRPGAGCDQYWLSDIMVIADVYDPARFAADPLYARHIGQLNILTYLIDHQDSNAGNFLIGRAAKGARVFSIDNGVAFASEGSDRGELWRVLRVKQLPADAIARLRGITPQKLRDTLGVVAQWQLQDGSFVPVAHSANFTPAGGVRQNAGRVQMGLTEREIRQVQLRLNALLKQVDRGSIVAVPTPPGTAQ